MRIIITNLLGLDLLVHPEPHMKVIDFFRRLGDRLSWPRGIDQNYLMIRTHRLIGQSDTFHDLRCKDNEELLCALDITDGAEIYTHEEDQGRLCHLFIPFESNGIDYQRKGFLRLMQRNQNLVLCPEPNSHGYTRSNTLVIFRRFRCQKRNYLFKIVGSRIFSGGISVDRDSSDEGESNFLSEHRESDISPEIVNSAGRNEISIEIKSISSGQTGGCIIETGLPRAIELENCGCDEICPCRTFGLSEIVLTSNNPKLKWVICEYADFGAVYPTITLPDI